jgi:hypothetical protein
MSLTATHEPVFTMGDGYSCRGRTEGPFPRASIYDCSGSGMVRVKGRRMNSALVYLVFISAPSSAWMLWSSPILIAPSIYRDVLVQLCLLHFTRWLWGGPALPLYLSPTASRQSTLYLQLHPLCPWLIGIRPHLTCSSYMARKRGRPRRGAAWEAQKEQRRRKEQLERALALATSILRQRARAERMARLATIAEPGVGCSRDIGKASGSPADFWFGGGVSPLHYR